MSATPARFEGLDIFRGLAVAGMIVVNTPGSDRYVWWPLDHAPWHGFTPTDLVFPAFLFAVGVAMALPFPRHIDGTTWWRTARRVALLIAIGWAWQMLARPTIDHFRLFGVLPRIGLCYGLAAALAMLTARRDDEGRAHLSVNALAVAALVLLGSYWALMALVPVPGFAAGDFSPQGNLAGYVDRLVVGTAHMWRHGTDAAGHVVYDPEGLLSTLPATADVLIGALVGLAWRRHPERAMAWTLGAGVALTLLGLAIAPAFPINKRIWTSSFALLTAGLSALLLAASVIVARWRSAKPLLAPLRLLGMNAILAYLLSLLIQLAGERIRWSDASLAERAFAAMCTVVTDPYLASVLCAVAVLALVIGVIVPLDRRGIHLRL